MSKWRSKNYYKKCCYTDILIFFLTFQYFVIGPALINQFRPDLKKKYERVFGKDDTRVMDYIYHCNAQSAR